MPATANAADPGRWVETGFSHVPFEYFQGITSDPAGQPLVRRLLRPACTGPTPALVEQAREEYAIPVDVPRPGGLQPHRRPELGRRRGRPAAAAAGVLLPFQGGQHLRHGVVRGGRPDDAAWRYYVKLDPQDIKKAMWVEASPDGSLIWTSAGQGPAGLSQLGRRACERGARRALIRPVRRLVDAVPPSGVTGAAFHDSRLFLAGQDVKPFQVWSIDTDTGERRLELGARHQGRVGGTRLLRGPRRGAALADRPDLALPPTPHLRYFLTAIVHFVPANRPPDCSGVSASPSVLWPPNHKLRTVALERSDRPRRRPR